MFVMLSAPGRHIDNNQTIVRLRAYVIDESLLLYVNIDSTLQCKIEAYYFYSTSDN